MSSPRKPDIAGIVQKEREREANALSQSAPKNKKHIILRLLRY